jgi:hypothetical protein
MEAELVDEKWMPIGHIRTNYNRKRMLVVIGFIDSNLPSVLKGMWVSSFKPKR